MKKINEIVTIIERERTISNVELNMKTRYSISKFEKLIPYVKYLFLNRVEYDRTEKIWRAKNTIDHADSNNISPQDMGGL